MKWYKYELEKVNLLGHSFGGMVGTLFAEANPDKVASLLLIGAPIDLHESFGYILKSSREIYIKNKDSASLLSLDKLLEIDTTSMLYSSQCFRHALKNGFYSPSEPSEEALEIRKLFVENVELAMYASKMEFQGPTGFWKNEKYTTLSLEHIISDLVSEDIQVVAIFGQEDGLYSSVQIDQLRHIVGDANCFYLTNCSHNVFIDQQTAFIEILNKELK